MESVQSKPRLNLIAVTNSQEPLTIDLENGKVDQVAQATFNNIETPVTGGAGGSCLMGMGGCALGAVVGVLVGAVAFVELWGTGTGLWVEGEKHDNEGLITAGHIVTYVGIALVGATGLATACVWGCGGCAEGSSSRLSMANWRA